MRPGRTLTGWVPSGRHLLEWSPAAAAFVLGCALARQGFDEWFAAILAIAAISALCLWVAWQDLLHFTISDSAVMSIVFLAIGARWGQFAEAGGAPLNATFVITADLLLPGAFMFLIRECFFRLKGYDGLGLGDVKLALAGGALAGAVGFCWALFAASALSLAFVAARAALVGPLSAQDKLAFGAALAPAVWTVWVMEQWPLLTSASGL